MGPFVPKFSTTACPMGYLLTVAGYSGDAGDAMRTTLFPHWIANGMMFSTPDSDNDYKATGNCGINRGWWFGKCSTETTTEFGRRALRS